MICVAGAPGAVADELSRRPAARFTEESDNGLVVRPIREPLAYRDGMSEFYLKELARRIQPLPALQELTVLLAYVAYEGAPTARFVDQFFPFAISAPLPPFYPDAAPKHARRQSLTAYADHVEAAVARLRKQARVVRDVLSGQAFTPLLLPLRNFRSAQLGPRIRALFDALGTIDDPRAALKDARESLLAAHPTRVLDRPRPGEEVSRYFQDDRALRFVSPGRNRHGMARVVGRSHRPSCLIDSRVRLGGPYDAHYHYDCDYKRGGLDTAYPNCHGEETTPGNETYVNIAPSDAIR